MTSGSRAGSADGAATSPAVAPGLPSIRVRSLRKVFGRHAALIDVDVDLLAGELVLVMGPNGAGKSTLLSILSTLVRPSAGDVRFGDCSLAEARHRLRHRIGVVPHAPLLYRGLTVRENLLFLARLYRLDRPAAAVNRILARLELDEHAERRVEHLSRGMAQRASLARALLVDPWLLLLDEPFSGLDPEATALLRARLAELRGSDRIIVVVSHDLLALDRLCDRLLVLHRGRLAADVARPDAAGGLAADLLRRCYDEATR